ncbi:MAG: hypothetical protein ACRC5C_00545, partial [Bacilli bacterium]
MITNYKKIAHICANEQKVEQVEKSRLQLQYGMVLEQNILGVLQQNDTSVTIQKTDIAYDIGFGA